MRSLIEPGERSQMTEPDHSNPYAPPSAPLEVCGAFKDECFFPDASMGKRFLNHVIDQLAMVGAGTGLGIVAVGAGRLIAPDADFARWFDELGFWEDMLFGFVIAVAYYTSLEAIFSRTLGKLITGTKVIRNDGGKPAVPTIVVRSLARLVPFEPFSFLSSSTSIRGWHDRWSGTRVIDLLERDMMEKNRARGRPPSSYFPR